MNTEVQPIDLTKVVIARKLSLLEFESRNLGLTQKEMLDLFKEAGTDWRVILASHKRQRHSLSELRTMLPGIEVVTGFQLTRELINQKQAIIALGGDDHYQYVSHFMDDQKLIPVNSDYLTSRGALADFTVSGLAQFLPHLKNGDYSLEQWTRLHVNYNDQPIKELAISQVFIGSVDNEDMGRYLVEYRGTQEIQKSSGVLVATGSGSGRGAWYDAANRYLYPKGHSFPRDEVKASFILREPSYGEAKYYSLLNGEINLGEQIKFTSLMNKPGRVGIDALVKRDFPRGTRVSVEISNSPLSVVRKALT